MQTDTAERQKGRFGISCLEQKPALEAEPLCDLLHLPRDASDSRKLELSPPTRAAPSRAPSASGRGRGAGADVRGDTAPPAQHPVPPPARRPRPDGLCARFSRARWLSVCVVPILAKAGEMPVGGGRGWGG